jgi:hypothetical protein
MKPFYSIDFVLRYTARVAGRRPFSVLIGGAPGRSRRLTFFYFGGWNALDAALCLEFPWATYLQGGPLA